MSSLLASAASPFRAVREQLAPVARQSRFLDQGVLTPEEFVLAGDLLVQKCPTWQWASGLKEKRKDYLPQGKQYLVTRNVPCLRRARDLEFEGAERMLGADGEESTSGEGEENWVETHVGHKAEREVGEMDADSEEAVVAATGVASLSVSEPTTTEEAERPADDEIPDMDEEDMLAADSGVVEAADPAALIPQTLTVSAGAKTADENILKTRTYDIR
jgi:ubiquitin-like-conjugating enzyme ATG3